MQSSNGGLAYGTSGNPQTRVMQKTYAAKVAENEAKLNARIAELNDGSFVVDDQETPRVEAL